MNKFSLVYSYVIVLNFLTFYLQMFFYPDGQDVLMTETALFSIVTLLQLLAAHCMWGSEQKAQLHPQVPYGAQKAH